MSQADGGGEGGQKQVMKRDDYRGELAAFQAARADVRQRGWRQATPFEPLPAPLHDRFSDLWSPTTIAALRQARQEDAARPETERRGGQTLQLVAEGWFIRTRCRAVEAELHRALTTPCIRWRDQRYTAVALAQLPADPDPEGCCERQARLAAHYAALIDLREQHRSTTAAAVQQLGYSTPADRFAAYAPWLLNQPLAAWIATCERFLAETETPYRRALAAAARDRALPDPFEIGRRQRVAEDLLRSFGIRPWQQSNITVHWRTTDVLGVFRARVPTDIRWSVAAQAGWLGWRRFLGELARVQHAAWTSSNLPIELRLYGDQAVAEVWSQLFADLVLDERWVTTQLDCQPPPPIRRAMVVHRWQTARRAALRCIAWYGRETAGWTFDRLRTEYAQHLELTLSDWDLYDELDAVTQSVAQLRGAWVAAALDDWLRTRYGRWYAARRAGDDLIDLWNTGFCYTAAELAALVGVGDVSPEAFCARLPAV